MEQKTVGALESLKRVMSTITSNVSDELPQPIQHILSKPEQPQQLQQSDQTPTYIETLQQKKELESLQQKLADKEAELKAKEEFLDARNKHIIAKAKSRKVDLDGDGVDDVEIPLDERGNDIPDQAVVINPKYKDHIPEPLPQYKNEVSMLLGEAKKYLDGTRVSLDNIGSVTSRLMESAKDFSDLNGQTKKSVVLTALGNIAITSAGSTKAVEQNVDFVQRAASNFIDILCEANKGNICYRNQPDQPNRQPQPNQPNRQTQPNQPNQPKNIQPRSNEEIYAAERIEAGRARPFCCGSNTAL